MNLIRQPLLQYQGGKWRIAPWIIQHFPKHKCYTESFGGGASVLLRKPPSRVEVYNDINNDIVNLFRVIREQPEELFRLIQLTPYSRSELALSEKRSLSKIENARRTLFCYRASVDPDRDNQETSFRHSCVSPKGPYWRSFVENSLPQIIDRLRLVQIECRDAEWVIKTYDSEETLHYIDPPYDLNTRHSVTYRKEFSSLQMKSLAELLQQVKGFVLVSGYFSEFWDRLLSNFKRIEKTTTDRNNNHRIESLWLSPRTVSALGIQPRIQLR